MNAPAPCSLCGLNRRFRRGLCRSCYRKLRDCGCRLPPRERVGRRRGMPLRRLTSEPVLETWLYRWLMRWPPEALAKIESAIASVRLEAAMARTKGAAP